MMSLNNCGYLRVAIGIVTAVVVSTALLQPPVNGEEASGMDREETLISADSVTITILYDNIPYDDGYTTSGGFACLVEIPGAVILFDSGGHGSILLKNMARLGVTPGAVDAVVLSHEHWDHTGGLDGFLDSNPEARVYIPGTFSGESRGVLPKRGIEPIDVSQPREIVPGVRSCGVMGEAIPEQSISISTDRGLIVITGCAHPGIAEITQKAKDLAGIAPLLVMGGWHLRVSSREKAEAIIEIFDGMGVRYVAPSHCTGEDQIAVFEEAYGERFIAAGIGMVLRVSDLR